MTSRFESTCHTCGKKIRKGEQIIYWPLTKDAGHLTCDDESYRKSLESFADEEMYNAQYC